MAAKTTDPIDILLEMGIDLDNLSEEEDYLSALMEATNALTITNSQDPRIGVLQKEIRKVRKQRFAKARPELKRKRVNPNNFFDRRQPEKTTEVRSNQEGSPIGSGQSVRPENLRMPEAEEGKIVKREPDVLKDILGGVISILETLKEQNKLGRKREDRDRKQSEKAKRTGKEDKLEKGPLEKFVNTAKKLVKPVQGLFDGLFKFIENVLIGRLLFKIIGWLSDPKNTEKLKAIGEFFKATWPALLAAFIVFKLKFGGFVGLLVKTIAGFIPKLLGLIPKIFKGVIGLAKLAIANPIAASVIGGTVLAALGAVAANQPGSATIKDPDDPEKSQMDEINEAGGMRGAPMSLDMFSDLPEETTTPQADSSSTEPVQMKGGGKVPGSGPNKDTVPAMLAPGEFVISRGAVQKYGSDTFAAMNAAGGGTNLPERMNGITYAVNGGQMGGEYGEKSEEQSSTVKNEMNKRREIGGGESNQSSNGGFFGGIKKFFGFGGSESGEDGKDGKNGEDASSGGFNESSLKVAMDAAGYTDPTERAMFLAQMAHESGNFRYDEEIHDGSNYEGRSDLGNTQPGDGRRYKGRGYIQLTGRANYKHFGDKLGYDLEGSPELAKRPDIAAAIAVSYWDERVNREAARRGDVLTVTKNINGGTNGLQDRIAKFKKYSGNANYTAPGGGTIAAASGSGSASHTTSLSGLIGGFDSKIMESLKVSGGGSSIIKGSPTSGSSIEPPHTTTLSTIMKRTGPGMGSSGSSSSGQNSPTRPADASPPNTIPPIDAEAMISHEKIKVLGIAVG
mgnify:CR=1 FL=1